jgi:hypothetical protein
MKNPILVIISALSEGGIAQLVERVVRNDEAWGSNPHTSTNSIIAFGKRGRLAQW